MESKLTKVQGIILSSTTVVKGCINKTYNNNFSKTLMNIKGVIRLLSKYETVNKYDSENVEIKIT